MSHPKLLEEALYVSARSVTVGLPLQDNYPWIKMSHWCRDSHHFGPSLQNQRNVFMYSIYDFWMWVCCCRWVSETGADPINLSRLLFFFRFPSCQVGKHDEAWMILKQIHDTNMRARGQPEKVFTVSVCFCCALSWLGCLMLMEAKRLIFCHRWDRF